MPTVSASNSSNYEPQRTILVVEDEVLIRVHVADYLRDAGFDVIEAPDGVRALEILRTDTRIDLVFTDVTLPGELDGFALAEWVRQHKPGLPLILTSGKVSEATPASRDVPFFAKPCDYADVAARIRSLLADD